MNFYKTVPEAEQARKDRAMLENATMVFEAWGNGEPMAFSYKPTQMAELMKRCVERVEG